MAAYAVIMAGGSGTRLWPLSRLKNPKFLLNPVGQKCLLEQTLNRLKGIILSQNLRVVCGASHVKPILKKVRGLKKDQLLVEPFGRNTSPAIGLAAINILQEDPEALLVVLPADHTIVQEILFRKTLQAALSLSQRKNVFVTVGIVPTSPHTGYGYMERHSLGESVGTFKAYPVRRFVEKPNLKKAKGYVQSGRYFWNAGIFVGPAKLFLEEIKKFLPKTYGALTKLSKFPLQNWSRQLPALYQEMDPVSIDYGVMEKTKKLWVLPASFDWKDVGDLIEYTGLDTKGDSIKNLFIEGEGHITYVQTHATGKNPKKMIVTLGVQNLLIIDTGDALLIADKKQAQKVRSIPDQLRKRGWNDFL